MTRCPPTTLHLTSTPFQARTSGILLHPTSLPDSDACSPGDTLSIANPGSGDFGRSAYRFIDWLVEAEQRLWQVLPLGPVGPGSSPYMSPSALALNPLLIDLQDLVEQGWLNGDETAARSNAGQSTTAQSTISQSTNGRAIPERRDRIDFAAVTRFRMACLSKAAARFFAAGAAPEGFDLFCATEADWLDDYALFMTLAAHFSGQPWHDWPRPLAMRDPAALAMIRERHAEEIGCWRFMQWTAHRQWLALKRQANQRGLRIVGDLPIFVAMQSADVWAKPELFDLEQDLRPRVVAGVPPDYFSATGQLWGNPLYRWDRHGAEGYAWWIRRMRRAIETADWVRVDHFRGFAACWEVPAEADTAIGGRWVSGPGAALFDALAAVLGPLPIIAEDLGTVTPDVTALREAIGVPGMRVLQFAFGDDARNLYLPHNHTPDSVVYSGTHDNDTSLGWFKHAAPAERARAQVYLKTDGRQINWDLIHAASQSVARTAIHPLQDVIGLDSDARMNRPGDPDGCWGWRFDWAQVEPWHARRLRELAQAHGRNDGSVFARP